MNMLATDLRILFVDDDLAGVRGEQEELERDGLAFDSRVAANERDMIQELGDFNPDVVLCDDTMEGFSGLHALDILHRLRPSTPILMVSRSPLDDAAAEFINSGASAYVLKSNLRCLGPAVRQAIEESDELDAFQARLDELEHYDTLTGLPNLDHVLQEVDRTFEYARHRRMSAAVVVINVDSIQRLDAAVGGGVADDLLCDVGSVLWENSRGFDLAARIGPMEFLLVLSTMSDARQAGAAVQKIVDAIEAPRQVCGRELRIVARAGVSMYPADGGEFPEILESARAAVREIHATSKSEVKVHESHARRRVPRDLEPTLRDAIHREELTLHYQPQFELQGGRVCGVEALARWFPTRGSAIAPSVFIALAEEAGLIEALGAWALRTACTTASEWIGVGRHLPLVSVNVSVQQINEAFTAEITRALALSGMRPNQLELEVTEDVLLKDSELTLRCLTQWKSLGVRIALDDFGAGYSSLRCLSRLPIDRLKIDGSLIKEIAVGGKATDTVRSAIAMGRECGFAVLAKGVETQDQLDALSELRCPQAQGYLMGAPQPALEARGLIGNKWAGRMPALEVRGSLA